MWREILVDDMESLEKNANLFNEMKCASAEYSLDNETLQRTLLKKNNCHCYQYTDIQLEIYSVYKYIPVIDRMYIFQFVTKVDWDIPFDIVKFHGIVAEYVKIIIERHEKMVRFYKYPQWVLDELEYLETKFRNSDIELRIDVYAQHGIRVIDNKDYWEYELM